MRVLRALSVLATVSLIACTTPTGREALPPSVLVLIAGNGQIAPAGSELPEQLIARVTDANGVGIEGANLIWIGDGEAWVGVTGTSEDGITRNYWTLGPKVGTQVLEVWTYNAETQERGILLSTFTAISTEPTGDEE
jgi:hypothetical protein